VHVNVRATAYSYGFARVAYPTSAAALNDTTSVTTTNGGALTMDIQGVCTLDVHASRAHLEAGLRTFSQPLGNLRRLGELLSQRLQFRVVVDLRVGGHYRQPVAHVEQSQVRPGHLYSTDQHGIRPSQLYNA